MPINTDFFKINRMTVNHDVTGSSPVGEPREKSVIEPKTACLLAFALFIIFPIFKIIHFFLCLLISYTTDKLQIFYKKAARNVIERLILCQQFYCIVKSVNLLNNVVVNIYLIICMAISAIISSSLAPAADIRVEKVLRQECGVNSSPNPSACIAGRKPYFKK